MMVSLDENSSQTSASLLASQESATAAQSVDERKQSDGEIEKAMALMSDEDQAVLVDNMPSETPNQNNKVVPSASANESLSGNQRQIVRALSEVSDLTRPDPPSVVDHRVVDEPPAEVPRGTSKQSTQPRGKPPLVPTTLSLAMTMTDDEQGITSTKANEQGQQDFNSSDAEEQVRNEKTVETTQPDAPPSIAGGADMLESRQVEDSFKNSEPNDDPPQNEVFVSKTRDDTAEETEELLEPEQEIRIVRFPASMQVDGATTTSATFRAGNTSATPVATAASVFPMQSQEKPHSFLDAPTVNGSSIHGIQNGGSHPPQQTVVQHNSLQTGGSRMLYQYEGAPAASMSLPSTMMMMTGRRKISLRLEEEVLNNNAGFLGQIRRRRSIVFQPVSRGSISISWFDGTSSVELLEHVRKSVGRKLSLLPTKEIQDLRIVDDEDTVPEEVVLSPYIPDGSRFLLRFRITDKSNVYDNDDREDLFLPTPMHSRPVSPSAAPSPHPKHLIEDLNSNELDLLNDRIAKLPSERHRRRNTTAGRISVSANAVADKSSAEKSTSDDGDQKKDDTNDGPGEEQDAKDPIGASDDSTMVLHSEDPIEARLRQITDLLLTERQSRNRLSGNQRPERQVIFTLANYFVLFLSFIAISAEIQARVPDWLQSLEKEMKSVQNCAANQEALFECVSNGDFAGLIASVLLWVSKSAHTKGIFLFGFGTPKKLWTVVYESFITAVCWGVSYLFIRRGMNPDTRKDFIRKYWKDAVYGSLAGFNASFLKQVLKNLIPQEAVEEVIQNPNLQIMSWFQFQFPSFSFP